MPILSKTTKRPVLGYLRLAHEKKTFLRPYIIKINVIELYSAANNPRLHEKVRMLN